MTGGEAGLVTAMMPAYNAAKNIGEAITSIQAQTYEAWELIVVDDGSTDETAEVVRSFHDPRIQLVRLPENRGRGFARNEVLRRARGEFIAICDSDDVSLPTRFERHVDFLRQHPEIGIVSSQVLYFSEGSAPTLSMVYPEAPEDIDRRFARGRSAVPNQGAMIRATLFEEHGPYSEAFRRAQDLDFFLRLPAGSFQTLPEPGVLYRQSPSDLSWRYFRENARYTRYAYYVAEQRANGGKAVPVATFARRPANVLRSWTVDAARYWYLAFRRRRRSFALR